MAKPVILTNVAEYDLEQISDYLYEHWGAEVCNKFLTRFDEICDTISTWPTLFPIASKKKKIRKCILTRQNIIYYRVHADKVEIITIFDTRQYPGKLQQLLG